MTVKKGIKKKSCLLHCVLTRPDNIYEPLAVKMPPRGVTHSTSWGITLLPFFLWNLDQIFLGPFFAGVFLHWIEIGFHHISSSHHHISHHHITAPLLLYSSTPLLLYAVIVTSTDSSLFSLYLLCHVMSVWCGVVWCVIYVQYEMCAQLGWWLVVCPSPLVCTGQLLYENVFLTHSNYFCKKISDLC